MNNEEEIRRLLRSQDRRIRRIFDLAINEFKDDLNLAQVARLIERGDLLGALSEIDQVATLAASASQQAFNAAAQSTTAFLSGQVNLSIGFDTSNNAAVQVLRRNRLEFITNFTGQQRAATRAALVDGVSRGIGPRALAKEFRDSVGLTRRQTKAVANYRRLLQRIGQDDVPKNLQREFLSRTLRDRRSDGKLKRLVRDGNRLSASEIEGMVERYRLRQIKSRSVTIARTEALASVHQGQDNAIEQSIQNGVFEREQIIGKWLTGQDGRQRDAHDELHTVESPHGTPFVNQIGEILFPGDRGADVSNIVNCRCARTIRIVR